MRDELWDYLAADATLSALVADRIYWDYAPASPTYPYVLLTITEETPDPTTTGGTSYRETTIQVDCIASTADIEAGQARTIAAAIEARLDGASFGNVATTVLGLSRVEVTNWDGRGAPPLEGWSIEIRADQD